MLRVGAARRSSASPAAGKGRIPITCLGPMNPAPTDYNQLLTAAKQRVREAQYRALQQVNQ